MLKGRSSLVTSLPGGKVYKNLNIWAGSGGAITPDTIENASIEFKVDKTWVQNNNIDLSTVTLNRYSGSSWNALPTTLVKDEGAYYYFKAKTSGFSPFSITGESGEKLQTAPIVPFREVPKTVLHADQRANKAHQFAVVQNNETNSSRSSGSPVIFLVSALVIVLLLAIPFAIPQVRNKFKDKVESKLRDILRRN